MYGFTARSYNKSMYKKKPSITIVYVRIIIVSCDDNKCKFSTRNHAYMIIENILPVKL